MSVVWQTDGDKRLSLVTNVAMSWRVARWRTSHRFILLATTTQQGRRGAVRRRDAARRPPGFIGSALHHLYVIAGGTRGTNRLKSESLFCIHSILVTTQYYNHQMITNIPINLQFVDISQYKFHLSFIQ